MNKDSVKQISLKIAKDNSKHLFVEYANGILLSEDMDFETTGIAFVKLEYRLKQILLEFGLELSPGEIEMNVEVKNPFSCPVCKGAGQLRRPLSMRTCLACNGTGKVKK